MGPEMRHSYQLFSEADAFGVWSTLSGSKALHNQMFLNSKMSRHLG